MKRIALLFAAMALCVTAYAQSWSSEWVPRHEFHIDGFGGLSALQYKVAEGFAPGATVDFLSKNCLGGGAGLGYTFHINENFGITTGAELAIYRGAFSASNNPWTFMYLDKGATPDETGVGMVSFANTKPDPQTISDDLITLSENQTLYAVQVPLMLQIMAPLNQRKSNHFYFALGARLLFNISGNYERSFTGFYGEKYKVSDNTGAVTYDGGRQGAIIGSNMNTGTAAGVAGTTLTSIGTTVDATVLYDQNQQQLGASQAQDALNDKTSFLFYDRLGIYGTSTYQQLFGKEGGDDGVIPDLDQKGSFKPELFNVAASGELGFRWGLGNGWGLYTGVYLDYGFLSPINPQTSFLTTVKDDQGALNYAFSKGSVLEMTYDDVTFKTTPKEGDPNSYYIKATGTTSEIASKFSNIGAGLKLKLAFGKAAPSKPVEPQIVYVDRIVRDTVVQTNTVTVRDTVVKTNTIIEKEIIRDTITIIKEIPVEIQKTMADLSNTMFDFNKSVIKDAAKGPLNSVVKWLQENPDVKVEISGHTDSVGSAAYNQRLSEARAKAVYDYFVSQGVDKFRLAYAGYGKDKPIATNETEEGRAQNRRVELNIIQ